MSNRQDQVVSPSVSASTDPASPGAILDEAPMPLPTPDVVILREADVDGDLQGAIARIRSGEQGRRSRILIVADEESDARPVAGDLPSPELPMNAAQVARQAAARALQAQGQRFDVLTACTAHFVAETHAAIEDAITAEPQGATRRALRQVADRLDYVSRAIGDLERAADDASRGRQPVDLEELTFEVGRQVERSFPALRVGGGAPVGGIVVQATAATLARALFDAHVLVAQRIGGQGSITVTHDIDARRGVVVLQIRGGGEPHPIAAADRIERLRAVVVDDLGGELRPDGLGGGACGITLILPRAPRA